MEIYLICFSIEQWTRCYCTNRVHRHRINNLFSKWLWLFVFHNREFLRTFKFLFSSKNRIQNYFFWELLDLERPNRFIDSISEKKRFFFRYKNCRCIIFFIFFLLVLLLLRWRYILIYIIHANILCTLSYAPIRFICECISILIYFWLNASHRF